MQFKQWYMETEKQPWQMTRQDYEQGFPNIDAAREIRRSGPLYPYLQHMWKPSDVWFHGTPYDFEQFSVSGVKRTTVGWNTAVGVHFTPLHWVAHKFADGLHMKKKPGGGRVIMAHLKLKKPIRFGSENDMTADALRRAIDKKVLTPGKIDMGRAWNGSAFSIKYAMRREKKELLDYAYEIVQGWSKDKRYRLGEWYRKQLLWDGYDSVLYRNDDTEEGPGSTCAIVLDPASIQVIDQIPEPHIAHVVQAIMRGDQVPPEVLKQYKLDPNVYQKSKETGKLPYRWS